jgi:hypothetical protein
VADPTAELIDRLLASGKVSRDTRAELGEFKTDLSNGRLMAEDRRYVESLAARLLGVGAAANDDRAVADEGEEEAEADDGGGFWEDGEDPEIEALRQRAEAAEARVAELEAEVALLKSRLGEA